MVIVGIATIAHVRLAESVGATALSKPPAVVSEPPHPAPTAASLPPSHPAWLDGPMSIPTGLFVGLATLDVVHHVAHRPESNEKVTALATYLAAGGPAANAAVTFAALGGRAVVLTALGRHPAADLIRADLAAHGVDVVDTSPDIASAPPVSAIAVTRSSGERSVIGSDAVASTARPPDNLDELIAQASVVLIDGHHPDLATTAARSARAANLPVVLDIGRWKPVMADLVPQASDVVCSADVRPPGTTTVQEAGARLVDEGVPIVVITQGAGPVLWWSQSESSELDPSQIESGQILPPVVASVDTLGAGDAFHGGYAFARASSDSVTAAIELGCAVASLRVQHEGPREWLTHLPELAP